MKPFSIIVAMDEKNGIGRNNSLPWRLSGDMKHFKEVTTKSEDFTKQNAVLMGRLTWDSLPEKFRPLPQRKNIVLTRAKDHHFPKEVRVAQDFEEALNSLDDTSDIEQVFIIGGGQIFNMAIRHKACQRLYVTRLKGDFQCDIFFPSIPSSFKIVDESSWSSEGVIQFRFCQYAKS